MLVWAINFVPYFASQLTMTFLFLDIAPILLIALPMTLIIVTGEIDLSVASVVGLSSVTPRLAGRPRPVGARSP